MTDSVIQFNYSDNVHLTTIYIKADTHQEKFIPELKKMIDEIDHSERFQTGRLNWENMVLAIINKISNFVDRFDGIKIMNEVSIERCNVIYRHVITPNENYSKYKIALSDTLMFDSTYPISNTEIFKGTLSEYVKKVKS